MITAEQARIIYELHREQGIQVADSFTPREVYPAMTGLGSIDRERVTEMARIGLFGVRTAWDGERAYEMPGWGPVRFVMMRGALDAYDEWAQQGGLMSALTPGPSPIGRGEVEAV